MHVIVNSKKCLACGACVSIAPNTFTLDESNPEASSQVTNPPKDSIENIKLAVSACPTKSISLIN